MYTFWDLIQEFPDKEWNWTYVSKNPNITWEIIRDNLDNPKCHWNWHSIFENPNITWEIIEDYLVNPNLDWSNFMFREYTVAARKPIKCNFNPKKINYNTISRNSNITPQMVRDALYNNPRCKWDFHDLSNNAMDQPYYKSIHHKRLLAKSVKNTIFEELIKVTCHPIRHPKNYMSDVELVDHPYLNLSKIELQKL